MTDVSSRWRAPFANGVASTDTPLNGSADRAETSVWLARNADAEKARRALVGVPTKVDVPGVVARAAELEREVIELRKELAMARRGGAP